MSHYINVFEIFEQFPDEAPKNLFEVEILEQQCRDAGKDNLAEYLFNWRTDMQYRLEAEWTETDAESVG